METLRQENDGLDKRQRPGPLDGHDDDLVGIDVAVAITGLSRATVYRKLADPTDDLPRPLDVSTHRKKFLRGELKAWRLRRLAERDAKRRGRD